MSDATMTTTTSRPILFSGPMVRALLAGCKTQTRRVALRDRRGAQHVTKPCPYGAPGDTLWVRETFAPALMLPHLLHRQTVAYRATDEYPEGTLERITQTWCPSIFMPRWASRLTLTLVDVSLQPLQPITQHDELCEGFPPGATPSFRETWDALNSKRGHGWNANPWVWRLRFTVEDHRSRTP